MRYKHTKSAQQKSKYWLKTNERVHEAHKSSFSSSRRFLVFNLQFLSSRARSWKKEEKRRIEEQFRNKKI